MDQALMRLADYDRLLRTAANLEADAGAIRIHGPYGSDGRLTAMARKRTLLDRAAACRRRAGQVDKALEGLLPVHRLVLELMCVRPQKGNSQVLCGMLACEKSTLYRHRDQALRLFAAAIFGDSR